MSLGRFDNLAAGVLELSDQAVVEHVAGVGAVRAQIVVLARDYDNRLTTGSVLSILQYLMN